MKEVIINVLNDMAEDLSVLQLKRLQESGQLHDVELGLNEFQVQMVIDNIMTYKPGERLRVIES